MKRLFSKTKRGISLFTAAVLLISLFAGATASAKTWAPESLMPLTSETLSIDFANDTGAEIPFAANNQYGTGSTVVKAVGVGSVPPVITTSGEMKFSPVVGCKAQLQDVTGKGYTDSAVYEFSFMMSALPAGTFEIVNGRDRDGNYVAYRLYVKNNGAMGVGSEGCAVGASAVVVPGKWYNVKFVTDMANQNYDCYINGIHEAENLSFKGYADGNIVTNIGRPFVFLENVGAGSFDIYYDNIRVYTEPVGRHTITADDFSAHTADVNYAPRVSDLFAGLRIIDTSSAQPTGIKVSSANARIETSGASILTAYGPTDVKKVVNEFDFTPTASNADQGKIFSMVDKGASAYGVEIYLNANNQFVASTETGDVVLLNDVKANETYSFKVYSDLSKTYDADYNGTVVARPGLYDVYINGVCAGTGLKFKYTNKNFGNITNLGRIFGIATNAASGTVYYDNVAIYTDIREDVLSAAANELMANADDGFVKASQISIPASSQSGYNLTWTSSDNNIINAQTGAVTHTDAEQNVVLTATVTDAANQHSVSAEYNLTVSALDGIKYYMNESFDDLSGIAKGDIMDDFKVVSCTDGISLGGDETNKYMVVNGVDYGSAIYQADIQVTKPEKVTLEFDFMQPVKGAVVQITSPHNGGGMDSISEIYSDGKDILYRKGEMLSFNDRGYVLVEDYEAGKWYNFKIYHDIASKEFEIYVDGVCRANHEPFRQTYTTYDAETKVITNQNKDYAKYPAAFHRLRFGMSQALTTFYVDNVKIYSSDAMEDLFKIGRINDDVTFESPIVLPQTNADGAEITWTSSSHEITDNKITVAKADGEADIYLTATAGECVKNYVINIEALRGVQLSEAEGTVTGEIYYDDSAVKDINPVLVTVVYSSDNSISGLKIGELKDKYITANVDISALSAGTYTVKTLVVTSFGELKPLTYADGTITVSDN